MNLSVDHSTLETDFIKHLNDHSNTRILFSGPFGTGKTTFIDEIRSKYSQNYIFLKLAPVNYSVSSNDDVFELIKFDLIIELLEHYNSEIDLSPEEFPILLTAQVFILEKMKSSNILSMLSYVSTATLSDINFANDFGAALGILSKVNKSGSKLLEEFKNFKNVVEENKDNKILKDFIANQEKRAGINESDNISSLIKDLIKRIKNKRLTNKSDNIVKSVLIIDDLDRLDPEHIFRLFNIFSAHYDSKDETNKFGFDKVIFVCDLNNIRNIYHHRYGSNVDFTGYIDKFFSTEPFDFDNRKFLSDMTKQIISDLPIAVTSSTQLISANSRSLLYVLLDFVFLALINGRQINFRMLLNYPSRNLLNADFQANRFDLKKIDDFDVLVVFIILKGLFHSWDQVHLKLKFLSENFNSGSLIRLFTRTNTDYIRVIELVVEASYPLLIQEKYVLANMSRETIHTTRFSIPSAGISFNFQSERGVNHISDLRLSDDDMGGPAGINPFKVLLVTYEEARKQHILK